MYVCGPTVYDDPHIGHLRSAYVFDVVRRALGFIAKVRFVRNVTDVDDKIIERAAKDQITIDAVSKKYLAAYHRALEQLGIAPPDEEPSATGHLPDMIDLTRRLVDAGMAYAAAGSVYFRVRKFGSYGKLSGQDVDLMYKNVRGEPGEGKEDVLDFALWKNSAPGEPSWDSPWGPGRPGWHIECSAMSMKILGATFDIHGGGRDLLFPHHENERAQSVGATGEAFARVWVHHGLLTIDGKKMSKSLGNFVTLDGIAAKGHTPDALKLFFLQSHYRSDVDFTWEKMGALQEAMKRFADYFEKTALLPLLRDTALIKNDAALMSFSNDFDNALRDDFDTPGAIAVLFKALRAGNDALSAGQNERAAACRFLLLKKFSECFGMFQPLAYDEPAIPRDWMDMLHSIAAIRDKKRSQKLYKDSDFIRDELIKIGFFPEDRKDNANFKLKPGIDRAGVEKKLQDLYRQIQNT